MTNHIFADTNKVSLVDFGGFAFYVLDFKETDNIAIFKDVLSLLICIADEIIDYVIAKTVEECPL